MGVPASSVAGFELLYTSSRSGGPGNILPLVVVNVSGPHVTLSHRDPTWTPLVSAESPRGNSSILLRYGWSGYVLPIVTAAAATTAAEQGSGQSSISPLPLHPFGPVALPGAGGDSALRLCKGNDG
jgi:hypothetical protein